MSDSSDSRTMSERYEQLTAHPASMPGTGMVDRGGIPRTEIVRLAYQLILGREPENEQILIAQSNFVDVYDLRNRFILSAEYQNYEKLSRLAELCYFNEEETNKKDTEKFDAFLGVDSDLERYIRDIIHAATVESDYTSFHANRFFDQVRAVVAIRHKLLDHVARPRILEIGTSPVTRMYAPVLPDIDLFTADLRSAEPAAEIARRLGSIEHYYIDLDQEAISDNYPGLTRKPFDVILFCEVIEHVLASPQEMIADLLRLLAPGGVLVISTPNAMSARHLFEQVVGRKADTIYWRNARELHENHHSHVREYTLKELYDACISCQARILFRGIKNYYADPYRNAVKAKYVSAGEVQVVIAAK